MLQPRMMGWRVVVMGWRMRILVVGLGRTIVARQRRLGLGRRKSVIMRRRWSRSCHPGIHSHSWVHSRSGILLHPRVDRHV